MVVRIRTLRQRRRAARRALLLEPLEARALLASFTTLEDTPLVVSDAALKITSIEGSPAHGKATAITGGGFSYVPAENYNGADSFTYSFSDTGSSALATGTVSLSITPVNDAPVAVNDGFSVPANGALEITSAKLLSNDTDVDSTALTVMFQGGSGPSHGTISTSASGNFVYRPATGFAGSDSFSYFAWDGQAFSASAATVTIKVEQVNQAPEARNDTFIDLQGKTLTIQSPGVLANDGNLNQPTQVLSATLVNGPAHGTLTLGANGGFTYAPTGDFVGADSFTYKASLPSNTADPSTSLFSNTATVTINIKPLNTPPVALNDVYVTTQNATLNVQAPGVLANDVSVSGAGLTAAVMDLPAHGAVTFNANGSFTYIPAAGFFGADSFTYKATAAVSSTDPPSTVSSNLATVTIYAKPLVEPPKANNDSYTDLQDTKLTVQAANGVLANDTAPGGNVLFALLVSQSAHGVAVLYPDGSFSYLPLPGFAGADSFTYKATTGTTNTDPASAFSNTATVTINVQPVNDGPKANNDQYLADQGKTFTVGAPGLLGNDKGGTQDHPLFAYADTNPSHGAVTIKPDGSFVYMPNADYSGLDSFTYRASTTPPESASPIALGSTATVTIYVKPTNPPPEAHNDIFYGQQGATLSISAPGILANDSLPTNIPAFPEVLGNAAHGTLTLNSNGGFTYVPNADFSGPDSFTYRLDEPILDPPAPGAPAPVSSNTATVTIYVKPLNTVPEARNDTFLALQDAALTIQPPGVLANDGNLNAPTLALTAALEGKPSHGTLTFNINGGFTYIPETGFSGADSFTYRAKVGGNDSDPTSTTLSNIATVTINVKPLNLPPPEAHNDYYLDLQGTKLTISAPGVLINDGLSATHPLVASLLIGPNHGAVTLSADGNFAYIPNGDFSGDDSFTYRASDAPAAGGTPATTGSTATVTIKVLALNNPPIAHNDQYATLPGSTLTVGAPGVLANDGSLINLQTLSAELVTGPAHGTLSLTADGGFTYIPTGDFSGVDSFVYRSNDSSGGLGNSSTATVTIVVAKPNPLHNSDKPNDVDGNTQVSPLDALLIINYLNGQTGASGEASAAASAGGYFDVDDDGNVAPLDALLVINWLNSSQTNGEGESATAVVASTDDTLALLSLDVAEEAARRKRTS